MGHSARRALTDRISTITVDANSGGARSTPTCYSVGLAPPFSAQAYAFGPLPGLSGGEQPESLRSKKHFRGCSASGCCRSRIRPRPGFGKRWGMTACRPRSTRPKEMAATARMTLAFGPWSSWRGAAIRVVRRSAAAPTTRLLNSRCVRRCCSARSARRR
jgi:hypothetical protein